MRAINTKYDLKRTEPGDDLVYVRTLEKVYFHDGNEWIEKVYFTNDQVAEILGIGIKKVHKILDEFQWRVRGKNRQISIREIRKMNKVVNLRKQKLSYNQIKEHL